MDLTHDQAADAVERHDCPKCEAPAGSPCRTLGGKVAAKYHTARFTLVAKLREELEVLVPAGRGPGRVWVERPPLAVRPAETGSAVIRIGYARCSMAEQEIASQLVALEKAGCTKVFQEKISTRVHRRPEMEAALALANNIKEAAPDQAVILTVHEMKRLARNAAELMQLSSDLEKADILLELLTGPLTGVYDPNGMGAMFFAVLAAAAQIERNYIREKTLEGQQIAAAKGNHGGRPKVIDDDMLTFALALKAKGIPVPEIAGKLVIKTGKNTGKNPSVASVYRALAEAEEADAAAEALADGIEPCDHLVTQHSRPAATHRPEGAAL
ncbi:DNA invertase Pin-like site-specific DNA recombinase [Kitasatospora sp. MAA19]|uniref:recombinase family protein n=1 Tax=Kitasatospora sp. MAA19 TaxID=3035090 RepID=UPI002476700C|nr:recombinase family protein [Kitasatospora sp. MAA19]MDH6710755.1 DNA invertase Pin-like site-specific DNA recombinase [Kitasatospora sp. MAA19]